MDGLKMPDPFARGRIKANQAFAEQTVARTMAAVVVVCRRAEWQVHVTERFVDGDHRPDVGVPGVVGRPVLPGVMTELAGLRHGVKGPQLLAGLDVESKDVAARLLLHQRSVSNVRTSDDDVLHT